MIRPAESNDIPRICEIINQAAERYLNHVPDECLTDPYMSLEDLAAEFDSMQFSVFASGANAPLTGAMAVQTVYDAELIRHAYVWPGAQRSGVGTLLLKHISAQAKQKTMLVGTWAAATWAIQFYQRHGFQLQTPEQTQALLLRYWDVPEKQRLHSIVLARLQ